VDLDKTRTKFVADFTSSVVISAIDKLSATDELDKTRTNVIGQFTDINSNKISLGEEQISYRDYTTSVEISEITSGVPKKDKTGRPTGDTSHLFGKNYDTLGNTVFGSRGGWLNVTDVGRRIKLRAAHIAAHKARSGNFTGTQDQKETAKAVHDSSKEWKSAIAAIEAIEFLDDVSDKFDIMSLFVDSFFYSVFPSLEELLDPDTFNDIIPKTIRIQIDRITEVNDTISKDNPYKSPQKMFPLISGPLEIIDMNQPISHGDPYWNQARVSSEIWAVMNKIVQDVMSNHHVKLIEYLGSSTYDEIKNDPTDSFINYITSIYKGDTKGYDQLYREAYSNVCIANGGTVYEDVRPSTDEFWKGRPRFQCGYSTREQCQARASEFINGSSGGQYSEWFEFSEINTHLSTEEESQIPITACALNGTSKKYKDWCKIPVYTGSIPSIQKLQIANPGKGYNQGTTCDVIGLGGGATISVTIGSDGNLETINSVTGGSGYTSAPLLDFSACGPGTGAAISGLGFSTSKPVTGMCMPTNRQMRAMCEGTTKGRQGSYDITTHTCSFTPDYCRSIGTCYNHGTKFCELPSKLLDGIGFVFGEYTPREWIRIHGCEVKPELDTILSFTPLALFTKSGQTFFNDLVANHANWGEGLKQTLSNPMMSTMVAQMTLPLVTEAFIGVTGTRAAASRLSARMTFPLPQTMARLGTRFVSIGPNGIFAIVMLIAMGIEIGVQFAQMNVDKGRKIPDPSDNGHYASNYTVSGWLDNDPQKAPKIQGFTSGWITKPIKAHKTTNWPRQWTEQNKLKPSDSTLVAGSLDDIPAVTRHDFYPGNGIKDRLTAAYGAALGTFGVQSQSQFFNDPTNLEVAVNSYLGVTENPTKYTCHGDGKIYAGAVAVKNKVWCMNPYPGDMYTDKINIGELAPIPPGEGDSFVTSNTWTDGSDFYTAQYPMEAVALQRSSDPYTGYWYYQLSYDKNNMVGMKGQLEPDVYIRKAGSGYTVNGQTSYNCTLTVSQSPVSGGNASGRATFTDGKLTKVKITSPGYGYGYSIEDPGATVALGSDCGTTTGEVVDINNAFVSEVPGFPKNLWNTELLREHFTDYTINSMRQYYCSNSLEIDPDGTSTHPKCWGYLSVKINNYKFSPMSILKV
jgi:hypothetical protein